MTLHEFPFNRHASYAETQRVVDLAAPRSVGWMLDLVRTRILEQGIREIVTAYGERRKAMRADARAHVRRLLIEAKLYRSDLLEAHAQEWHPIKPFEDNARASLMDCIQAFKSRNHG